jgi:hypothetical protein
MAARKPRDPNAPVKVPTSISLPMPANLREKVQGEMPEGTKDTLGTFLAKKLASLYGVVLPPRRTRSRYATPQERIEAQKQKRLAKAELIKRLLAEHEAKLNAEAGNGVTAPAEQEAVPA